MSLKYYYCKLRSMHSKETVQCVRPDSASMRSGAWTPSTHTKTRHDTCVYSPSIWWTTGRDSWIPKAHWPVSLTEMAASGSEETLSQGNTAVKEEDTLSGLPGSNTGEYAHTVKSNHIHTRQSQAWWWHSPLPALHRLKKDHSSDCHGYSMNSRSSRYCRESLFRGKT